jgi:hypothetical protein
MGPRLRKMKIYHPRRKRTQSFDLELYKQSLHDLKHKISSGIGNVIVHYEEGNVNQINDAQLKARSEVLKHGTEMEKIAQKMGDRFVRAVRDYLDSVDIIVHSGSTWIDDAKIHHCYTMTEKLEKELCAA